MMLRTINMLYIDRPFVYLERGATDEYLIEGNRYYVSTRTAFKSSYAAENIA